MIPPDKINPGADPLVNHGGVSLPTPRPKVTLAFRARSGCYLAVFVFFVLLVLGLCSATGWGAIRLAAKASNGLEPLLNIDHNYIAVSLICGSLVFLAFVVGFVLPPWKEKV